MTIISVRLTKMVVKKLRKSCRPVNEIFKLVMKMKKAGYHLKYIYNNICVQLYLYNISLCTIIIIITTPHSKE